MLSTLRGAAFGALCIASVFSFASAQAQDAYPSKPVHFILGFQAGGGTDTVARIVSNALGQVWGISTVPENRPGAGGQLAADIVAGADPDGYTLLFTSGSFTISPAFEGDAAVDPLTRLRPVSLVSSAPYVLLVNKDLPVENVQDLIALAKSKPGELNFASAGPGSGLHLAGELFNSLAGIKTTHIPYQGVAGLPDVISGRVQFTFTGLPQAVPLAESGELRALAVTTATRSDKLPDVPTMEEAGVAGYEIAPWYGLLAPAGTPDAVVDAIYTSVKEALGRDDVKAQLADQGLTAVGMPPMEFEALVKTELVQWKDIVTKNNLTLE
jgi:tripartite-type tricarboxylate transporter receptor subunit TctC